eukprot:1158154-Pelagomonas_calceolata.AAC.6
MSKKEKNCRGCYSILGQRCGKWGAPSPASKEWAHSSKLCPQAAGGCVSGFKRGPKCPVPGGPTTTVLL